MRIGETGFASDAIQSSPALVRQRRQKDRLAGNTGATVQMKNKPANLEALLAGCFSGKAGSCNDMAEKVCNVLRTQAVDNPKDVEAVVLRWLPAGGAATDPLDHTACLVQWGDTGKVIVDTTLAQFGGEQLFVGSLDQWKARVTALRPAKAGSMEQEMLAEPISAFDMSADTARYALRKGAPAGFGTEFN